MTSRCIKTIPIPECVWICSTDLCKYKSHVKMLMSLMEGEWRRQQLRRPQEAWRPNQAGLTRSERRPGDCNLTCTRGGAALVNTLQEQEQEQEPGWQGWQNQAALLPSAWNRVPVFSQCVRSGRAMKTHLSVDPRCQSELTSSEEADSLTSYWYGLFSPMSHLEVPLRWKFGCQVDNSFIHLNVGSTSLPMYLLPVQ